MQLVTYFMRKLVFFIPLLLSSLSSIAQTHAKDSVIRDLIELRDALNGYYSPNADSVNNNCWEGCVFIRFNIGSKKQFVNIAYTMGTPAFIKDGIAHALKRINQRRVDIHRLKNTTGKTYILPFIVINRDGCGFMSGWEDANYKPDEKITIRQLDYHQSTNSIFHIIDFTDGKKIDLLDCVLLPPVHTPIVMY